MLGESKNSGRLPQPLSPALWPGLLTIGPRFGGALDDAAKMLEARVVFFLVTRATLRGSGRKWQMRREAFTTYCFVIDCWADERSYTSSPQTLG